MLGISRASVYYIPRRVSEADLKLMRAMDELHLEYPFAGSRMLRDMLRQDGFDVGRKHVATLMRRMGIEALYRKPRTTRRHPEHRVYPYLLREMDVCQPNQVWAMDITYIPMARGLFISRRYSIGTHGECWRGGYRYRWTRRFASKQLKRRLSAMGLLRSSTPTRVLSLRRWRSPSYSSTTTSASAWTAKAV